MVKKVKSLVRNAKKTYYTLRVCKQCAKYNGLVKANYKSIVTSNTYLGKNVNFNGIRITGKGKVTIGDNFHSGQDCLILTSYHDYDNGSAIPYGIEYINKDVTINDNVWLGDRVILLGGIEIGEGAIIQAGSVVVSDIPKYGIAGGSPAKVFKYRDITHYENLKTQKRFH
jgi:chloramphenicol O-acetyltransferase type B